ncbi:unnamed protein product, partial [Effrenium voratum]
VASGRTVPWYTETGAENVVRHPKNQRRQVVVRDRYKRSICHHGILEGCRGEPWLVEQPGVEREETGKVQVQGQNSKLIEADPRGVSLQLRFLRDLNNRFHEGGRISFLEQVEEVQHVEDAGAWTAYMERRGFTNRNVENVRDEFGRWLQSSEYKEKYGPESYKFAKALKNKLRHFRIFESWVDFFSREADFLSPDMSKPEVIVRNMNTFGACIEMFSGSYAPEELGYVLMELSKFCAAPLYVFNRGSESQLMAQAQEKLNCIVAGAIFVRKIAPGKPEPSEAASKKRARAPDLEPADAEARKNAAAADGEEEQAADLEADIVMPMTGGLQPRLIIASAISLALRFAFGNGITINNKFMKDWSKVRPMLQSLARGAIAQESSSLPGGGVDDIFAKLLRESQAQELAAASGRAAAAGTASSDGCSKPSNKGRQPTASDAITRAVAHILGNAAIAQACDGFVVLNNDKKVVNHPAFAKFMNDLRVTVLGCTCDTSAWDTPSCPFHDDSDHTIADYVWGLCNCLKFSEVVPTAVPMLGASALVQLEVEYTAYAARKQKAMEAGEEFSEKEPCPMQLLGKPAKFLLRSVKGSDGKDKYVLNEHLVTSMVTCRASYLLEAARNMIKRTHGSRPDALIRFTDCKAEALDITLDALRSGDTAIVEYIMEAEGAFHLGPHGASDDRCEEWAAAWTKVLTMVTRKVSQTMEGNEKPQISLNMFPEAVKIFGQGVKGLAAAGQPSFADIYSLCDVKPDAAAADPALAATAVSGSGKMRVIDIMHIQRQIENFFLAKADTKGTLTVLAVDKLFNQHESGALERMLHPDAASERRLHVCGSVTTEASWKNFKVADAVFPNGLVISYYMHGDGWNKQTSLLPHPFWMMKNGFEAQKACCLSSTETISKTFQDTCLGPGTPGPTRKDRNVSPAVWLFDIFIHCQINMTWPHSRPCCGEPPSAHKRRSGPPEGGGWGPGWGGPVGVWRVPLPAVQGKAPT